MFKLVPKTEDESEIQPRREVLKRRLEASAKYYKAQEESNNQTVEEGSDERESIAED